MTSCMCDVSRASSKYWKVLYNDELEKSRHWLVLYFTTIERGRDVIKNDVMTFIVSHR